VKYIISGSRDNTIKVWEVESGKNIATLKGHTHYVSSVAFSPDSKLAISGSYDETVKVWDIAK
jgi:WD40 repeat protein